VRERRLRAASPPCSAPAILDRSARSVGTAALSRESLLLNDSPPLDERPDALAPSLHCVTALLRTRQEAPGSRPDKTICDHEYFLASECPAEARRAHPSFSFLQISNRAPDCGDPQVPSRRAGPAPAPAPTAPGRRDDGRVAHASVQQALAVDGGSSRPSRRAKLFVDVVP
jgi:hypothetical protein